MMPCKHEKSSKWRKTHHAAQDGRINEVSIGKIHVYERPADAEYDLHRFLSIWSKKKGQQKKIGGTERKRDAPL